MNASKKAKTKLKPAEFKRAIQAIDVLGATPAVLAKVAELAKDPNTDLEILCDVMRNDGSLAADIIRISNSPYYAPATLHSSLASAVNSIGLREFIRVVNLSLARQLFARDLPSYGITAQDYWSASIAAALVMEALAKQSGLNPEDAYTIGILHALGRVLINRVIEEFGATIYWNENQPIEEWERNAVGFDYAEAGALLLEHWRFPTPTCDVIRGQLNPGKPAEPVTMLHALQFTRRLLALTGVSFENAGWQLPVTDPYLRATGLTPEQIVQLVTTCRADFDRILQSVDLK
jgi:HD-like signal output (HDOD) protein